MSDPNEMPDLQSPDRAGASDSLEASSAFFPQWQARILIVDDDAALLQALPSALRLRMPEAVVDTVDSAFIALERIEVVDYDAIVSDIKMPGMDGLALLAHIRTRRPDTPTLLITGHGEHDLAVQALRGGAYDFIQKPIEREYFVASLQRATQTRRLRRQVEEQQRALERHAAELEATVAERTRELQEAIVARQEFINITAHELKTPMTSLKALAQIVYHRLEKSGQEATFAARMERALRRMELLINDLLDSTHIEAGRLNLHIQECDVIEICRQAAEEQQAATRREIALIAPDQPIRALADGERLCQALINLLSNAAKYSPAEVPITLGVEAHNGQAHIWVRDRGTGIPSDAIPHLYERFYRAPEVNVQSGSSVGLGLGLYITHAIVERHGGQLDVESAIGQGSVFTIRIPCVPAAMPAHENTQSRQSAQ
ncbi:MAG TPA: hybrid sensor histidine kinase/response regulator [Ktedonobacterales bacterium]|nr:hybrid sensor histidine kinase/response regulator [Ktedonobacterales bacterium]